MSINLMSTIFQTEFRDLQDAEGQTTKASTAKIVLLAMADNANDEGEGIYPSIESLAKKCALSEQTIRNTFDALLFNGIIYRVGVSKHGTHNHTINTAAFPKIENKRTYLPLILESEGVKPVEGQMSTEKGSNEYLKGVKPVDPNHHITIKEPNRKGDILDGILEQAKQSNIQTEAQNAFEQALGFGNLPWGSGAWERFGKWVRRIYETDPQTFTKYQEWRKSDGKYVSMSNKQIRLNPDMFVDTGYPAFMAHISMYGSDKPKTKNLL